MKSTGGSRTVAGIWCLVGMAFWMISTAPAWAADAALPCPPQLRSAVQFWIRVYTQIDTNEGFLHDPNHLGVVYETVHFTPGSSPAQRQHRVDRERDRLAAELRSIAAGVRPLTAEERHIRALWGPHAGAAQLRKAAGEIRFQLGQSNRFKAGLIRSGAWQHAIAHALAAHGLPPQLAALPLVESAYNPDAYSKDGAAGLWQFMPGTARRFLRMGAAVDQRFDPFSATVAAAQLLAYNHRILGTWPLAITAYNQGVAGVLRAEHAAGSRNIATIVRRYHSAMFGFASRNFYVSFLAALYVEHHAEQYFGQLHRLPEEHFQEVMLPGYVSVASLTQALRVPAGRLRELNPALLGPVWSGQLDVPKGYRLRLPDRGRALSAARLLERLGPHAVLAAQLRPPVYRVRWGDTLSGIADRYHMSIGSLARFNGMSVNGMLRVGERLHLPGASRPPAVLAAAPGAPAVPAAPGVPPARYRVRSGDTLSGIAARYRVSLAALVRANAMAPGGLLRVGQTLRLPASRAAVSPADQSSDIPAAAHALRSPRGVVLAANTAAHGVPLPAAESRLAAGPDQALARAQLDMHVAPSAPKADPQPVSAHQAEALGPMLGPEGDPARSDDPTDYSVAPNGTIRVAAAESLGYYAEWLGVSAMDLRRLNHLPFGRPVRLGERIRLDFRHVTRQQFQQRRIAYHRELEASYFGSHRIDGTRAYVTRSGDSLWTLMQHFAGLPAWLLRQYNPQTNFFQLRPGTRLVIPRIVPARAAG